MSILIKKDSKRFPKLLREIQNCPRQIYTLGNSDLLKETKVMAVVGSRKMSQYGREVVGKIIPQLVERGYIIVSGMALGVDAEVHKICLENKGKTIAVLAAGVDIISPLSNKWIYEKIREKGLIISEYPNGTEPTKEKFRERNRIISGLADGVIVIEGSERSGTLLTAKYAAEQGREVYAVPGRMTDENSWAPNFLIKNGVSCLTDINDIQISNLIK